MCLQSFDRSNVINYLFRLKLLISVYLQIPLDDVVELIMVDETPQFVPHTFHFHGYAVRIIASESFNRTLTVKDVEDMYYNGTIKKNLKSPVMKDTFFLPARGYVIVRFKATNPGN